MHENFTLEVPRTTPGQTWGQQQKAKKIMVIKVCVKCDYVEVLPEYGNKCPECEYQSLAYWEHIGTFKTFIRQNPEKAEDLRFLNPHLIKAYEEVMAELALEKVQAVV